MRVPTTSPARLVSKRLGKNPDEVLSREAIIKPDWAVVGQEERQIEVLNALKEAIINEL